MAITPEGRVKKQVKELLISMSVWYFMPVQNGMGVVGIPDFICCWDGLFLAIETKAPGKIKNVTANQKRRMDEIRASNGLALVVDDVRQLEDFFHAHKIEEPQRET